MKDYRIVFMGTPDFAVPALHTLVAEGYQVVAVVTQPDRPKGRKRVLEAPPVKVAAQELKIPVLQPERVRNPEDLEKVLALKPDLIVTAAFGQILPKELLDAPPFGCINLHASLLPKYRGGAPIHHAIMNGEKETGITLMYMVEELDAGDMIAQRKIPIESTDHVGSMFEKLAQVAADLLKETLPDLFAGNIEAIPQNPEEATISPNIKREDEKIDWHRSAEQLYNQVRGLHPWPVAYTLWKGKPFKVWWAEVVSKDIEQTHSPGTIVALDEEGIDVQTGKGLLRLKEIQPAGKRRLTVAEFVRGRQMRVGERLGEE